MLEIFESSNFILGTFDALPSVLASPGAQLLFKGIETLIIDDAHSLLEPELLIPINTLKSLQ